MGNVATYMAAGPDAASATWSLSGADMGDFMISSTGVLTFSAAPNYEAPADANADNTYMVTVEANDGTNTAMKAGHRQRDQRGGGRNGEPVDTAAQGRNGDNCHPNRC